MTICLGQCRAQPGQKKEDAVGRGEPLAGFIIKPESPRTPAGQFELVLGCFSFVPGVSKEYR